MAVHTEVTKRGWIFFRSSKLLYIWNRQTCIALVQRLLYFCVSIVVDLCYFCHLKTTQLTYAQMFKAFYQTVPICTNVTCTSAGQANDRHENIQLSKCTESVIC